MFTAWPFLVISKPIFVYSPKLQVLLSGIHTNFFTWYRFVVWVSVTLVIFVLLIISKLLISKKIKFTFSGMLLISFGIWIILAAILSPYKEAWFGQNDRTRGAFAYMTSILFMIALSRLITTTTQKKIVLVGFAFCTVALCVISLLQFAGIDIFTMFPLNILLGNGEDVVSNASEFITFAGMYNKLVLGGFFTIAVIVFAVLFFKTKKHLYKYLWLAVFMLSYAALVTTGTRGAWVAIVVTVVLYLMFTKKNRVVDIIMLLVGFIIIFVILDIISNHRYLGLLKQFTMASLILLALFCITLFISVTLIRLKNRRILFFILIMTPVLLVYLFSIIAPFRNNRYIMTRGSIRIYMFWKVSEVMTERPFFGTGPDCLGFYIDHEDPYRYKYMPELIIDKAHSVFYQIATDAGIPAMILFIILLSCVLASLWKRNKNRNAMVLFWAIIAWCIQGLSFDASICTDPFFFGMIGLGLSYVIKDELKNKLPAGNHSIITSSVKKEC